MKKASFAIILGLFVIIILSSCKTQERCPAYGETRSHQIERPNY